ncbi:hypothetical protein D3C86_1794060 [compost metagenome]
MIVGFLSIWLNTSSSTTATKPTLEITMKLDLTIADDQEVCAECWGSSPSSVGLNGAHLDSDSGSAAGTPLNGTSSALSRERVGTSLLNNALKKLPIGSAIKRILKIACRCPNRITKRGFQST